MSTKSVIYLSRILIVFLLSLTFTACTEIGGAVRKVTYPPDFKYVSGEELRSNMQKLAYQLQLLDQSLTVDKDYQINQQLVVTILRDIERISTNLKAGEAGSNHPFLQDTMTEFANSVGQARISASLNPPRYYQAGRISGGCTNCHKVNR